LKIWFFWSIRNGKSVVAWDHCWLEDGIRISELNIDIPGNLKAATVFELILNR
jgi:hypothetical protein